MSKVIYLAGGCFWGLEKAFQSLKGVEDTTVGYANGIVENPTYEMVKKNDTEFRETVRIVYNEDVLPLPKILKAFFLCIDPTQKNQQKHDIGTQYQTGVYYIAEEDYPIICQAFEEEKKKYPVFYVEMKPLENFYDAEEYHQDYLIKNPSGYCHITREEYEAVKKLNEE